MSFLVLTAEFAHETNTFNVNPTGYDAFVSNHGNFGADAIRERGDANTELAGFLDTGRKHGWEIRHVLSAHAEPAGSVTRDAFDRWTQPIVAAPRGNKDRLHGIAMPLHGPLVTAFCEVVEGELLERLPQELGRQLPIARSCDPPTNNDR